MQRGALRIKYTGDIMCIGDKQCIFVCQAADVLGIKASVHMKETASL